MPDSFATTSGLRSVARKWWIIGFFCVIALFYAVQSTQVLDGLRSSSPLVVQASYSNQNCFQGDHQTSDAWLLPESSLKFAHPTALARDNLLDDSYYITSFAVAGFTNEFIAYMHLMFLAMQTGRIAIIPPIIPAAHVSAAAGTLKFSNIFNMSILRNNLRHPIIEWADLKIRPVNASITSENDASDPTLERIGCWSTRPQNSNDPTWVRGVENALKLDMSFTRVPNHVFMTRATDEIQTTFPGLVSTVMPKYPHQATRDAPLMAPSRFGSKLKPGEQLSCFDFLYFVSSGIEPFDFQARWSPVWNMIGTHLKFTDSLMDLATEYLKRAMKLDGEIPPMITIHIRRGDFASVCKQGRTPPCFLPVELYRAAVVDMQRQILETKNINVTRVLIASDEEDPAFWNEISSYGWNSLNHTAERTVERFGEWYPLLIDKATLSMGIGFVGTEPSTFSALNARRVEDWNGGATRMLSYFA